MLQPLSKQGSSLLALFETTKTEREEFVTMILDTLNDGQISPLDLHLQVKCMEDLIAQLKDQQKYKDAVLNDAEHHGKKFTYKNAAIDIREVGTKYDYTNCNDDELNQLTEQSIELAAKLKARQKFLQLSPIEGTSILNEATGEVTKVYPPSKTSTTSVVVSLK
jgi:hypothetical protein